MYSIQHYVIKFVSDLRQVNGFLRVLQFSPPIKLTDILLKGALNTINHENRDSHCLLLREERTDTIIDIFYVIGLVVMIHMTPRKQILSIIIYNTLMFMLINVREHRRGNQNRKIQTNWQHWVHKTTKN